MQAIIYDHPGDESVLHVGEAPAPELHANEIRIRVHATAINRADLLQREGRYPPPPGASTILGMECAGVVAEVGADAGDWSRGERVMALLPGGGYAVEAVVDSGSVMRVPELLSADEAAALPEVFLTAFSNIFMFGRAGRGESILVHGGGSGVGTAATTLAKLAGLRVIVTAGSDEKCARCIEHGADVAINYNTEDFREKAKDVDLVLDHIGAKYLARDLEVLRSGGRVIVIGSMGGEKNATVDVGALVSKRLQVIGSTLRGRTKTEKAAIVAAFLERFGGDLRAGRIRPVIDSTFDLHQAADAHRRMAQDHFGKIVLRIERPSR